MRWEDERYVRYYTRNTPEWLAMSWHARGLFGLILREVDRAGILKLGKIGLRGVAVVLHAPWPEIEPALRELLDDGCLKVAEDGSALIVPNFIEAQETPQSDAARKRKSRESARATFPARSDETIALLRKLEQSDTKPVTNRDDIQSRTVTESHVESRPVTSGHSVPSVPCRAVPEKEYPPGARARVMDAWSTQTGNLIANPSAASDMVDLVLQAATRDGREPEVYIAAFVAWVESCPADRKPQKAPHKFVEHFAAVQEWVRGERKASPTRKYKNFSEPRPHIPETYDEDLTK